MQRPPPREVVIVSGTSKHLRKSALLAVLIAIVGLGAASAMAALAAGSAAKPFELVLNGGYEYIGGGGRQEASRRRRRSASPDPPWTWTSARRRFTCADGSGSITLHVLDAPSCGRRDWSIVEGTGQYAGLRGRGTVRARIGRRTQQHVPGVRGRRRRGADDRPREREGVQGQGHEGRVHDSGRARHPRRRRGEPSDLQGHRHA